MGNISVHFVLLGIGIELPAGFHQQAAVFYSKAKNGEPFIARGEENILYFFIIIEYFIMVQQTVNIECFFCLFVLSLCLLLQ